jgi:hypothetical protein
MPDEPDNKMDEVLRAYARERRKSPELRLHPAMRKMLQAEVQRAYSEQKQNQPGWRTKLRAFWPQIAFGGALCAMLLVAVLSIEQKSETSADRVKQEQERQIKAVPASDLNEKESLDRRDQPSEPLKKESEASGRVLADKVQLGSAPAQNEEGAKGAVRPAAPLPAMRPSMALREEKTVTEKDSIADAEGASKGFYMRNPELMKRYFPQSRSSAPNEQKQSAGPAELRQNAETPAQATVVNAMGEAAAKPVLTAGNLAVANDLTNLGAARRTRFVQLAAPGVGAGVGNRGASIAFPVLRNFQVEQSGQQLRLIDNDGSVYTGEIESSQNKDAAPASQAPVTAQSAAQFNFQSGIAPADVPSNTAVYFVNARGTNRTLGRDVVLTGNYLEQTNNPTQVNLSVSAGAQPQTQAQIPLRTLSQARRAFVGTAVVGKTNQVPIQAVSNDP